MPSSQNHSCVTMRGCSLFQWSLMYNCVPATRTYRASRSNYFFMQILMISFVMGAIFLAFCIGRYLSTLFFLLLHQHRLSLAQYSLTSAESWPKTPIASFHLFLLLLNFPSLPILLIDKHDEMNE